MVFKVMGVFLNKRLKIHYKKVEFSPGFTGGIVGFVEGL